MAPMTNKERQAAFRARRKVQPFAEKHFEGMHVATLEQFLHAVEVDKEEFLSLFPAPDSAPSNPRDSVAFKSYWYDLSRELSQDFVTKPANSQRVEELASEAKRRLHEEGYFSGLPEYSAQFKSVFEMLVLQQVEEEVDRLADEWLASPEAKKAIEDQEKWEAEAYADVSGIPVTDSRQYPLHQLIDAYKTLLALP